MAGYGKGKGRVNPANLDQSRARFAAFAELWTLQNQVGFSDGGEYHLQAEAVVRLAKWLKMPRVAVELLNASSASNGLRAEDLREWEAWRDRRAFLDALDAEDKRCEVTIEVKD